MRIMPADVERLIPEEHEARAIWDFVGRLDLGPYYKEIGSIEGDPGRPAYDLQVLTSIWIYAYSRGIGSTREIARRTEYDPPFQWITALEIINYHTLSDFRITHKAFLDRIFVEVLGILSAEGLITLVRTTQDGTKVKACPGTGSFRKEEKIKAHLKAAEEQIRLLQESEEESGLRLQKADIRMAKERKERLDHALEELKKVRQTKAGDKARVSMTDPDVADREAVGRRIRPFLQPSDLGRLCLRHNRCPTDKPTPRRLRRTHSRCPEDRRERGKEASSDDRRWRLYHKREQRRHGRTAGGLHRLF